MRSFSFWNYLLLYYFFIYWRNRNIAGTWTHGWRTNLFLSQYLWVVWQGSSFSSKTHFSSRSGSLRPPWPTCPLRVPQGDRTDGLANSLSKMPEMLQPVRLQASLIQVWAAMRHLASETRAHQGDIQKCTTVSSFSERANEMLQEHIFYHGNIRKQQQTKNQVQFIPIWFYYL